MKMHADEIEIDEALVSELLADQFPRWARLPVRRRTPWGTDNALFRLGAELSVRLPRAANKAGQVEKDFAWLPKLAPHLPLALPEPVALGRPGPGFPFGWGVYRWLPGETSAFELLAEPVAEAKTLAGFINALQAIDVTGAPLPGPPNFGRGADLIHRDGAMRTAFAKLEAEGWPFLDAAKASWQQSLGAAPHDGAPVWIHGDLLPGNLLVEEGRLSAVIDCAGLVAGDPAGDLLPAWSLLRDESREVFRASLAVDADAWLRGRGWALYVAVTGLSYYTEANNPSFLKLCREILAEVLAG